MSSIADENDGDGPAPATPPRRYHGGAAVTLLEFGDLGAVEDGDPWACWAAGIGDRSPSRGTNR